MVHSALDLLDADFAGAIGDAREALETATYGDYVWRIETLSTFDVGEAIQHAVVTGTDPGEACAFLFKQITGEDRFWEGIV